MRERDAESHEMKPLRLLVYDRTCRGKGPLLGLSHAWSTGSLLYRALDRLDASLGAASWSEALDWISRVEPARPIGEVQFWGHGKWGDIRIANDPLDVTALDSRHPLHERLRAVRERTSEDGLWWFRTCETFGAQRGHEFARAWSSFFDCRVAGHTFVIGYFQSGLHLLHAGQKPHWDSREGLIRGTAERPERAAPSTPLAPNTITCFTAAVPSGY